MREGSVVLLSLRQADGLTKNRPAIVLRHMPGFGDLLVCGVSSQLHQIVNGFDEVVAVSDADFKGSGLQVPSLIRLGFLATAPARDVVATIGRISGDRHQRLLQRLAAHLTKAPRS